MVKFKINNQYELTDLKDINLEYYYSSIAYNKDTDELLLLRSRKIYIADMESIANWANSDPIRESSFKSSFDTPSNLTVQGMGYYDGHAYLSCAELGHPTQYQSIYNNQETLSSLIYRYDLTGNLVESLYIPNSSIRGEIESCSFDEDGTLVASYNYTFLDGKKAASLYKGDVLPPNLSVNYSTTEMTNKDVLVTINSNEEMMPIEGWTLSIDKKAATKTYPENVTEELKICDYTENETQVTISINNIDKISPEAEISYSTTEETTDPVTVTIHANEAIKNIDGWTKIDDNTFQKKYYENTNGKITINIEDLAGNKIQKEIEISNIREKITIESDEYSINNMIITLVSPDTSVLDFLNDLNISTNNIKVYNKGHVLLTESDFITTDSSLLLDDRDNYKIVVVGDLNKDGHVTISDLALIQRKILNFETQLDEISLMAGDINNNKTISISDLASIQRYILTKQFK